MIKDKTVLVLGAGASASYGFPIGTGLREKILELANEDHLPLGCQHRGELQTFIDDFRRSNWTSIDTFLSHRPNLSEIGKRCIAKVLLRYEAKEVELVHDSKDHWYEYFWNYFSDCPLEELTFKNVSVVNFNYDRSFECFLAGSIRHGHGCSDEVAKEKLRTLDIQHVYGSLGGRLVARQVEVPYLAGADPRYLELAARNLKVIPDHREEQDEVLTRCRQMLSQAERICFLGFAFDPTNMKRLKAKETCLSTSGPRKKVFASTYKMYPEEAIDAALLCGAHIVPHDHFRSISQPPANSIEKTADGRPSGFVDAMSLDTLRQTLALGSRA